MLVLFEILVYYLFIIKNGDFEELSNVFKINYSFKFTERTTNNLFSYEVVLDKKTLIAQTPNGASDSEWTRLGFSKCSICPLDGKKIKHCPIAYNLSGLFSAFQNVLSIEKADITVTTEDRTYFKHDTIQQGLRSIFGIYMAASGCPHMSVLKPMVRFHLPFASIEETIYRHVSNYLLGQYYGYMEQQKGDFLFQELRSKNESVDAVNHGICHRIENVNEGDAIKNALTILNVAGLMVNLEIESKLDSLKYLYH